MSTTYTYTRQLVVMECCACHMHFGVPTDFDARRVEDHRSFYCPAGHSQSYTGPTPKQQAEARAAELERRLASRTEDVRAAEAEAAIERRRAAAARGQLTKARNRANAGVCLHCNRSFANVQRHVAHMHPEAVQS